MNTRGAYSTKQRSVIVDYLREHPMQKLTADEIALAVGVGRTTVYRLMESLAESSDVHKYQSAEGQRCYQYVEDPVSCAKHAHAVCTVCGELVHLECTLIAHLADHLKDEHGFVLDDKRTVLYGRCAACAGKGEVPHGADDAH